MVTTSKEDILRRIGEDESLSVSTLYLHGSWNNLSDEKLRRKISALNSIVSSKIRSNSDKVAINSFCLRADLDDETMEFCIGDQNTFCIDNDDDVTMTDTSIDGMDFTLNLKAPDALPALFIIQKYNQHVATAHVPIEPYELLQDLEGSYLVSNAIESIISTFQLEPNSEGTTRSLKRPREMRPSHSLSKGTGHIRIFVAGDRSQVGKSSICLGLLGTLLKMNYSPSSLAYIKPATQCEETQLVAEYCKKHGIDSRPVGPVVYYRGFTRAFLNGETESSQELLEKVSEAVDSIAKDKAVVIIDGVGYPAVGSITGTDNCSVAMASGYVHASDGNDSGNVNVNGTMISTRIPPGILIVGKRGVGDAVDSYNLNSSYFRIKNVPILGAIFNRLPVDGYYSLENCKKAVTAYFEQRYDTDGGGGEKVFGFIPEVQGISNSRSKTDATNHESSEKKSELEVAMEHAETFILEFGKNVDVGGILDRAAELRDTFSRSSKKNNIRATYVNKKIRILDEARDLSNSNHSQKLQHNTAMDIRLTRDQIEQAAKSAGAAGG